ncbi:MAG: prenyltransferase/squalene oxidase repeat-containing protein [Kiritimatiellae bacterium]|nr:prenyltransferase/squalene oxidase repeat-containing protein [Kiritimatiellia bacterium]
MGQVDEVYVAMRGRLLALRDAETGVWTGELSSSALATALAATALATGDAPDRALAASGAAWLAAHANADGGWGDTPESVSNVSTTLIATAALRVCGTFRPAADGDPARGFSVAVARGEAWVVAHAGALDAGAIAQALSRIYGGDRTFAVPILAFLAMCGENVQAWRAVPPLPFLLALLPRRLFRFMRLQVVSYALPALIAVGLCRHICVARISGRFAWGKLFVKPLLRRLAVLQPVHGGFLDAIPLTAFVCLSLRCAGYGADAAVQKGLAFLRQAVRGDGSWAIDSNLRTWVTSLATRAVFAGCGGSPCACPDAERVASWLVAAQHTRRHPFTGAKPGGWAWTDLPGGVPDADDTSGALIALKHVKDAGCKTDVSGAARNGVGWLIGLQNADGGMPTFCKGWGKLPFDRSCPDISAHALAALAAWEPDFPRKGVKAQRDVRRIRKAEAGLIRYLERTQAKDGSWTPLWFGNQEARDSKNPVIGTARVVEALRAVPEAWRGSGAGRGEAGVGKMLTRGEAWLLGAQREDGGWGAGAGSTVEETAWAVIALADSDAACQGAARRGCGWLAECWEKGEARPAPIGLYFSSLWYHEKTYPLVWAVEALGRTRGAAHFLADSKEGKTVYCGAQGCGTGAIPGKMICERE